MEVEATVEQDRFQNLPSVEELVALDQQVKQNNVQVVAVQLTVYGDNGVNTINVLLLVDLDHKEGKEILREKLAVVVPHVLVQRRNRKAVTLNAVKKIVY